MKAYTIKEIADWLDRIGAPGWMDRHVNERSLDDPKTRLEEARAYNDSSSNDEGEPCGRQDSIRFEPDDDEDEPEDTKPGAVPVMGKHNSEQLGGKKIKCYL